MYAGFVVTAIDLLLSLMALGRYGRAATTAKNNAATFAALGERGREANQAAAMHTENVMAGAMAVGVVADVLGLACWVWLAVATRRGHGWTRVAGPVLLGIYSICALTVVFGTHDDASAQFMTVVVWAIGVATIIPLWSQQARDFFFAWRKR
jgi:hypothetical protein